MSATVQLVTYNSLTRSEGVPGTFIRVLETRLHMLLRSILPGIKVDEAWYRMAYADVAQAIKAGEFATAGEHYISVGYFEDRQPRPIAVDSEWYLSTYPDVAYAHQQGRLDSAQEHFDREGFREGRLPYEGWFL